MWPFVGLLSTVSFELRVPGQDSEALIVSIASGTNYAGIRFNSSTGDMDVQQGIGVTWSGSDSEVTENMWIHADAKDPDIFDSSLYECRYVNVTGDTSQLFGSTFWAGGGFGSEDAWVDLTSNPNWYVRVQTLFDTNEVVGTIQIREKGNPSNIRSGILRLRAIEVGL